MCVSKAVHITVQAKKHQIKQVILINLSELYEDCPADLVFGGKSLWSAELCPRGEGGGYSREFWIGVCREGS